MVNEITSIITEDRVIYLALALLLSLIPLVILLTVSAYNIEWEVVDTIPTGMTYVNENGETITEYKDVKGIVGDNIYGKIMYGALYAIIGVILTAISTAFYAYIKF